MNTDGELILSNLCVLAALSQNDKLCTLGESFDIYAPTSLRGLVRMWNGERRNHNVQRVRQTVRAGIAIAQKSVEDTHALREAAATATASDMTMRLRIESLALQHLRMVGALHRASGGLRNLLRTYQEDAALASQITLIISEVDDFVRIIEPHSASVSPNSDPGIDVPNLLAHSSAPSAFGLERRM